MTFGSLFAGIGGFDLGFERAGLRCVWQVEIDPWCRRVLAKHWPDVPKWDDVKTFTGEGFERPDVICGGFPCQDISAANYRGKGIAGSRSGLWSEFARAIRVFRPSFAVIENVTALTFRGLDRVLFDLAQSGFDAEWQTIPASLVGAPHQRDRLFVVAYPVGQRRQANAFFDRCPFETASAQQAARVRQWAGERKPSDALHDRIRWCPDSELCRVANELPDELDRYRGLGNSVVPAVAEFIGRQLIAHIEYATGKEST